MRAAMEWKRLISAAAVIAVTVMMGYTAWESRAVDVHMEEVVSPHYRMVPDDENYCYHIYDESGEQLGGVVEYMNPVMVRGSFGRADISGSDRLQREISDSGRTAYHDIDADDMYLLTGYLDCNACQVVPMDGELYDDIITAMGRVVGYAEPIDSYVIETDDVTGLSYIYYDGEDRVMGSVMICDSEDKAAYDALAADYWRLAPELLLEEDAGYIYADLEVKGLAFRHTDGFLYMHSSAIVHAPSDPADADSFWSLSLNYDEYHTLADYMRNNKTEAAKLTTYEEWTAVFDRLGVEHDLPLDPDSKRYQAAMAHLTDVWGTFPAPGVSEEIAKRSLQGEMKKYDEDGDLYNFYGIAGMDATDMPPEERHIIIDVPEEYRRELFEYEKNKLMDSDGLSRNYERRYAIYRDYQRAAKKSDRLKGTYTLNQYDEVYLSALLEAIQSRDRKWQLGDEVEPGYVEALDFETVESCIVSDGVSLSLTVDSDTRIDIKKRQGEMIEWLMRDDEMEQIAFSGTQHRL